MPLLEYTSDDFPFQPFTIIRSADVNQCFDDIQTLLNTTGLTTVNIQPAGLAITALNGTGATAGQFVSWNGTSVVWSGGPFGSQYNVVIGSAAQVTAGVANYSTFAAYQTAGIVAGDRILVLPAYTTNESWTFTVPVWVQGCGHGTLIAGAISLNSGSTYTRLSGFETQSNLTVASGVTGCICTDIWFSGTNTFIDNNNTASNYFSGVQG